MEQINDGQERDISNPDDLELNQDVQRIENQPINDYNQDELDDRMDQESNDDDSENMTQERREFLFKRAKFRSQIIWKDIYTNEIPEEYQDSDEEEEEEEKQKNYEFVYKKIKSKIPSFVKKYSSSYFKKLISKNKTKKKLNIKQQKQKNKQKNKHKKTGRLFVNMKNYLKIQPLGKDFLQKNKTQKFKKVNIKPFTARGGKRQLGIHSEIQIIDEKEDRFRQNQQNNPIQDMESLKNFSMTMRLDNDDIYNTPGNNDEGCLEEMFKDVDKSINFEEQNLEEKTCLICFDSPPDAIFMDCGHGGVCYGCAMSIWKTSNECHLCRKSIDNVLQLQQKGVGKSTYYQIVASTQRVKVQKATPQKEIESELNIESIQEVEEPEQFDDDFEEQESEEQQQDQSPTQQRGIFLMSQRGEQPEQQQEEEEDNEALQQENYQQQHDIQQQQYRNQLDLLTGELAEISELEKQIEQEIQIQRQMEEEQKKQEVKEQLEKYQQQLEDQQQIEDQNQQIQNEPYKKTSVDLEIKEIQYSQDSSSSQDSDLENQNKQSQKIIEEQKSNQKDEIQTGQFMMAQQSQVNQEPLIKLDKINSQVDESKSENNIELGLQIENVDNEIKKELQKQGLNQIYDIKNNIDINFKNTKNQILEYEESSSESENKDSLPSNKENYQNFQQ